MTEWVATVSAFLTVGSLLPEKSHGQSKTIDRGYQLFNYPRRKAHGTRAVPWLPAPNGDGKPQRMIQ
jgi:hypothetical protein